MTNITVIPFNGDEIKPQSFQSLKDQPQSKYDLDCVNKKGFKPGNEINNLLDNEAGKEVLREIGSSHENGHVSRCKFITEQSTKILGMTEPTNSPQMDYKAALLARNSRMHIPDEINAESRMAQHKHKTAFEPPVPTPKQKR